MALGPHVGYRRVRADPRITPGWTEPFGTERFRFQNRKTVPNGSAHFTAKLRHLGPHVGYRWVRADPRITPGPADRFWNRRFRFQNRKTVPNGSAHFCFITAPRTPCGVPLGPGRPQDHARMDGTVWNRTVPVPEPKNGSANFGSILMPNSGKAAFKRAK